MRADRVVAVLLPFALIAACGDDDDAEQPAETTTSAVGEPELEGTVTVLAATSLKAAFEDLEAAFEEGHPGIDVQVTTDGSANLATAIIEGAPADVFAPADESNLRKVVDEGLAPEDGRTVFVTNRLQMVVGEGNPLGIEGLEDLSDPDVALSLCQEEVPCGEYAQQAFEAAGLPVPPAGQEDKVSGVLTKVMLGEADAGLVYVTDVLAADGVEGVDLAPDEQVQATYPASVLTEAPNPEAAAAFVAFLTDRQAEDILQGHGFGLP
jgi:molybdate transport system substrate-binding protein